jgi:uncharacterized secreted repeat protein (TIGR03808 family)
MVHIGLHSLDAAFLRRPDWREPCCDDDHSKRPSPMTVPSKTVLAAQSKPLHRRGLLALLGATGALAHIGTLEAAPRRKGAGLGSRPAPTETDLVPDLAADQSAALQLAVDRAALRGVPLVLPPGRFRVAGITLRPGSHLIGTPRTVLEHHSGSPILTADRADGLRLERLSLQGPRTTTRAPGRSGLVEVRTCRDIAIDDIDISGAPGHGISLAGVSGRISRCRIERAASAGLFSIDAAGLEIEGNRVTDCADNGILVWRSIAGEDGTLISDNRIERIGAASGGSGQYGNGINVFRAGDVRVSGNRIVDCAYSAIRANAASNVQMTGNSASRIGEVALYAEFGFQGALIASNIVDGAATGISVTNFNVGGRLAVIQGNLVRNLHRREHEPVDKRGEGIAVEADAAVSGNTIEGAPTAGIVIGWGAYMRDVAVIGNVIRSSGIGVSITSDPAAGTCLVAQNLIADAAQGAIRMMDRGRPTGDDLLHSPPRSNRIAVTGNVVGTPVPKPGQRS